MGDENLRAVTKLETMKFASENDLLYIGESSALADINIKEVVETLMEKIHEMQQQVEEKRMQNSMKLKEKYSQNDKNLPGGQGSGSYCCNS